MGLFSFRKPPARVNSSGSVPHTADLLYPAVLPAFSEIAAGEHRDPRAVFYTIRFMDPQRSRPFTPDVLDASDFGSKAEVRRVLVRRGFVQNADAGQTLSVLYTKDAMKELLRKRGLSVGGTKEQQAARLLADGFRISPSRRLFGQFDASRFLLKESLHISSDFSSFFRRQPRPAPENPRRRTVPASMRR